MRRSTSLGIQEVLFKMTHLYYEKIEAHVVGSENSPAPRYRVRGAELALLKCAAGGQQVSRSGSS